MKDLPVSARKLVLPRPVTLIGNAFLPAATGAEMEVLSPIDRLPFTTIVDSSAANGAA